LQKEYLKQNPLPLGRGLLLLMRKIKNTFQSTIRVLKSIVKMKGDLMVKL